VAKNATTDGDMNAVSRFTATLNDHQPLNSEL
jgi:hypothetical protein